MIDAGVNSGTMEVIESSIDMEECSVPPFPRYRVVFFLFDVPPRASHQIGDLTKTVFTGQACVDPWIILQIFAVEYCRVIDFEDRGFQFAGRPLAISSHVRFFPDA